MTNSTSGSGDGSRPTTSGGIENLGAAKKFADTKTAGEDVCPPGPQERMQEKRKDAESAKNEDSSAFNLHENPTSVLSNQSPTPTPTQVISSSDPLRRT